MAVPKKKTSKAKKRARRSHLHMDVASLARCSHCGAAIPAHRVCHNCGHYGGKAVMDLEEV